MEESGATAAAPPPLPPKTRRTAGCVTASATPAAAAGAAPAGTATATVGSAGGATVLGGGAPCGGGSGAAQPLSSISTSGEHVVKIRINPDSATAGSIRISVGSQDSTVEDMVRRPADAFIKQPERNNPYFFCSSFPTAGMVISSGQSSPSDTLDSGTCSDLDGSTPPPLPKKNGVSAAAAAAAAAAATTVTVTVNGSHPQHRRTASLTSSGNDADSDEDAGSNISCDSLNSHEINGGGELDDGTHYSFSKLALSNGHHKHSETTMESIQEEKILSPPSPTLRSVALTVRANNLVNNPMTAQVAPLVAATAATVTANNANNSSSAHISSKSFSALNNSFGVSNNSFGASNNSFGASNNSFGASNNSFGASNNSFGASNNSFGASNKSVGASDNSISASDNSASATVNGTSTTNVVTFNGPVVNCTASTNGVPKPPPPKTPAKPAKAIPLPPTPPKTPSSPTGQKTFLPQGLLQDIRDRTATLSGVSSTTTATTGPRKLRTWGEITPPKTPEPQSISPEPKEYPKNQSSLYRILQTSPSEPDAPPKTFACGGIVKERTYEERTREITAEAQSAAAMPGRSRIGSYKYEEDRYYQFHLNERELEPEDPKTTRAADEYDEETFAGLKDIMGNKEGSSTIRSAKGTVRGVKNRVRAGIATFLHYPDTKNYKEKEAGKVVLYVTTMGIVRHTFQECLKVKKILRTLLVKYEERDAFMSREVQNELRERMHSDQIMVPQLFVEGQHIGDAETIERLNETGELRKMLKPFKSPDVCNTCQVCGGFRLLPCSICNGSKKSMHRNDFTAEFVALKCMSCDEVGLVKCHAC